MDWTAHMRRIVQRMGQDITRRQAPGGSSAADATVRAVFLAPYAQALEISPSNQPQLAVMSADIPEARAGDVYVVSGAEYRASEPPQTDPVSGLSVVPLREVP